jgi:hypothetical protein
MRGKYEFKKGRIRWGKKYKRRKTGTQEDRETKNEELKKERMEDKRKEFERRINK